MKIATQIFETGADYTISRLYVDGVYCCYIMEDVIREGDKVYGKTAIPRGVYNVVVTMSNRFKRLLPLIEGVEGFSGVRIHTGNTSQDTEGCLLPGLRLGSVDGKRAALDSRQAFSLLFSSIQRAIKENEKITIELK